MKLDKPRLILDANLFTYGVGPGDDSNSLREQHRGMRPNDCMIRLVLKPAYRHINLKIVFSKLPWV
jgi:hypothetical protein